MKSFESKKKSFERQRSRWKEQKKCSKGIINNNNKQNKCFHEDYRLEHICTHLIIELNTHFTIFMEHFQLTRAHSSQDITQKPRKKNH